jgi:tetratricopeptide (TPR) repeat protein
MRVKRRWWLPVAVVALAVGVTIGGALAWHRPNTTPPAVSVADPAAQLQKAAQQLRERLARLPGDAGGWASLGMIYVQLARVSADAGNYAVAQQALDRSLAVRPQDNEPALSGLAALAAARHEFGKALGFAQQAVQADGYSAAAYGTLADAYIELGRYDEGFAAVQKMTDLRPDTGSYARASYSFELRGNTSEARRLMDEAVAVAEDPSEVVFALQHQADLALGAGDLAGADAALDRALQLYPQHAPLLAAAARAAIARHDLSRAAAIMRTVVARQPLPSYLMLLADILTATGDTAGAAQPYELLRAATLLSTPDIDLVLFEAEHGDPAHAVAMGRELYAQRPSIGVADALGWALHHAGQDAEAAHYAGLALRLGTKDPQMLFHRGIINQSLGRNGDARADLSAALAANPAFSPVHAPQARTALAQLGRAA